MGARRCSGTSPGPSVHVGSCSVIIPRPLEGEQSDKVIECYRGRRLETFGDTQSDLPEILYGFASCFTKSGDFH